MSHISAGAAGDKPVPQCLLACSVVLHWDAADTHSVTLCQPGSGLPDLLAVNLHNGPVYPYGQRMPGMSVLDTCIIGDYNSSQIVLGLVVLGCWRQKMVASPNAAGIDWLAG